MWPRLRRQGLDATRRYPSGGPAPGHDERLAGPLEDLVLESGQWEVLRRQPLHPDLPARGLLDHVADLRLEQGHAIGRDDVALGPGARAEHLEERVDALGLQA